MGYGFETAMPILFGDALERLRRSGKFIIERAKPPCLYDGHTVSSLDGRFATVAGRKVSYYSDASEEEKHTDLLAHVWFFKCSGSPRYEAWRFMRTIGDVLGTEIMTETWWDPLSLSDEWSVGYVLGLDDADLLVINEILDEEKTP